MGWGKCHSKQRSSAAGETKEEGNATRQVQEEQGQTWKIWEEDVTGTSAALTGQYVGTKQRRSCLSFGYLWMNLQVLKTGYPLRFVSLIHDSLFESRSLNTPRFVHYVVTSLVLRVMLSATLHPEHQQKITHLLLLY